MSFFLRCWGFILFLQMQIFNSSRVPICIVAWAKHGLIMIFKRLCVCQKFDFFNIIFDSESSEEIIVIDARL